MNRFLFYLVFAIYIAINAMIFLAKLSIGHDWFNQWIFDKFFIFQFISIVIIGMVFESKYFNNLTFIRIGDRRSILKKELSSYYSHGFVCLTIMFMFIVLGAFLLKESNFFQQLMEWYVRYLLGIIIFINVMSCLKYSNNLILRRYCKLLTFLWLAFELTLLRPYVQKFYSFDINLLFSWVFHKGPTSFYYMLGLIVITLLINTKICDKRDFV